jgi:RimJ/RimL family protein N-acetyltransferase
MIHGDLVTIRAVDRHDDQTIWRWFNDPAVMRGWGLPDPLLSRTEVQRRIEEWLDEEAKLGRPVASLALDLTEEPVGLAILSRLSPRHRSVELSFLVGDPVRWDEGFGRDIVALLVDTCALTWNLERIVARSEGFNERAHRLLRSCGFVEEARLREARYIEGSYHDILVFGWLRSDHSTPVSGRDVQRDNGASD